jgi:hypothetical protein
MPEIFMKLLGLVLEILRKYQDNILRFQIFTCIIMHSRFSLNVKYSKKGREMAFSIKELILVKE